MQNITGGVLAPKGFIATTASCGINSPKGTRKDLVLVDAGRNGSAAGVFTTNRVQAAPVILSKKHLQNGMARAIVINSGNANACNGEEGMENAGEMAILIARELNIPSNDILVASTGVIGRPLPMDIIRDGIKKVACSKNLGSAKDAAESIMTTDTTPKSSAVKFDLCGASATIGGMAKGAGMICPNMATMIGVLTTDVAIAPGALQSALNQAVAKSFNCITVDGDMSTNDTVFVLANYAAENSVITQPHGDDYKLFCEALDIVCIDLAKKIARDGEGATKLVEIKIKGAQSEEDARTIGMSIANSALVKTAIYGHDPNWGRILCAIGYSDAKSDPDTIDLFMCEKQLTRDGKGLQLNETAMRKALSAEEIPILVDLKLGDGSATIWTCDMSHEYVTINAEYTT